MVGRVRDADGREGMQVRGERETGLGLRRGERRGPGALRARVADAERVNDAAEGRVHREGRHGELRPGGEHEQPERRVATSGLPAWRAAWMGVRGGAVGRRRLGVGVLANGRKALGEARCPALASGWPGPAHRRLRGDCDGARTWGSREARWTPGGHRERTVGVGDGGGLGLGSCNRGRPLSPVNPGHQQVSLHQTVDARACRPQRLRVLLPSRSRSSAAETRGRRDDWKRGDVSATEFKFH
jgi:hypothetical protein